MPFPLLKINNRAIASLKRGVLVPQNASSTKLKFPQSISKQIFMFAHKTCAFPMLLNVATVCAVIAWVTDDAEWMQYFVCIMGRFYR